MKEKYLIEDLMKSEMFGKRAKTVNYQIASEGKWYILNILDLGNEQRRVMAKIVKVEKDYLIVEKKFEITLRNYVPGSEEFQNQVNKWYYNLPILVK